MQPVKGFKDLTHVRGRKVLCPPVLFAHKTLKGLLALSVNLFNYAAQEIRVGNPAPVLNPYRFCYPECM